MHVIDGSSQQPEYEFDAVRLELEMFNPEVTEKPFVVVYNKMDLPEASENWMSFTESLRARGIEPFCMSAAMADGTHEVICAAYELVRKKREAYKADDGKHWHSCYYDVTICTTFCYNNTSYMISSVIHGLPS